MPEPGALAFVGEGECPPDFDRMNWAAFVFALFWSVAHGPRPWGRIIWGVFLAPLVVENAVLLFVSESAFAAVRHVVDPLELFVWVPLWAYYGYNADRWLWQREHERIAQSPGLPAKVVPLEKYRRTRLFWTRVWLALLYLGVLSNVVLITTGHVTWRELAPSTELLVFAALFVLDLRLRRRRA